MTLTPKLFLLPSELLVAILGMNTIGIRDARFLVGDEFDGDENTQALRSILALRQVCRGLNAYILAWFIDQVKRNKSSTIFQFMETYPRFMIRVLVELAFDDFIGPYGLVGAVSVTADFIIGNLPRCEGGHTVKERYVRSLGSAALIHLNEMRMCRKLRSRNYTTHSPAQTGTCERALIAAIYDNNLPLLRFLLQQELDINVEDEYFGNPLYLAVSLQHTDTVGLLLNSGASLSYRGWAGKTALHIAAQMGHDDCAQLLLQRASVADLNCCDDEHRTPLFWAVERGRVGVCELLLSRSDIDYLVPDSKGVIPLEFETLRKCKGVTGILQGQNPLKVMP
ncbi:hypothetical protein FQN53_004608 [Emmonsiellopsis sp. PD_33]|nr:hypothetical protein FQN53_004608 [Emmonsiellopsis sp. PD_33]